jgi:hypothetical protein
MLTNYMNARYWAKKLSGNLRTISKFRFRRWAHFTEVMSHVREYYFTQETNPLSEQLGPLGSISKTKTGRKRKETGVESIALNIQSKEK